MADYSGNDILFNLVQLLPYILVTSMIYYAFESIVPRYFTRNRNKLANTQREAYYQKLISQSTDHAKEEEDALRRVKQLEKECSDLRSKLHLGFNEDDNRYKLQDDLNILRKQEEDLLNAESDLRELGIDPKGDTDSLKLDNEALSAALENYQTYPTMSEADPKILQFLETHDKDLSISQLENVYNMLLELSATKTLDEVKSFGQSNHIEKMNNLRIEKKKAEMDLQKMQERYKKELDSFSETRLDYLFKIGGANVYLEDLKFLNEGMAQLIADAP